MITWMKTLQFLSVCLNHSTRIKCSEDLFGFKLIFKHLYCSYSVSTEIKKMNDLQTSKCVSVKISRVCSVVVPGPGNTTVNNSDFLW